MSRHHAQRWRVRTGLAVACVALLGATATMQESPFPRGIGKLPDFRGFQGMNDPRLPEALKQGAKPEEAAEHASDGLDPSGDLRASPEYKKHLARVLTKRAIQQAQGT